MNDFSITDGTIQKITSLPGKLSIDFKDWKEDSWTLIFENLIAFQSIGAEGEEIAEISMQKSEFLENLDQDDLEQDSKSYSFLCAWYQKPVLIVIASSFEQIKS
ncbi:hypothetical protein [Pseudomonas sp. IT-P2]|uniref:hypothetical protein n=1 Tax=Pseudomonas sp. IT-P2 TaxID=3026456 RepID=UPI0039DFF782